MARKKQVSEEPAVDIDTFAEDLMKGINKDLGKDAVYNLGSDDAPIDVKRWIPTSLEVLDWICAGRENGGYPDGKLVEISGPESIGKSHLAYQIAKNIQQAGGITMYIDTESASAKDNLINLGIDVDDKKFLFGQADFIEDVFKQVESFIKRAALLKKENVPLCVVWDSVGGIGSIKDAEREYDDSQQPGVDAKALKRGFRRLMNTVGYNRVLFIVVNQQYTRLDAERWEKKTTTGGGNAIRYAASIRIELIPIGGRKALIYPNDMDPKDAVKQDVPPIGIRVKAKTIKNKLTSPFRSAEFEIHFGVGLRDHHQRWDLLNDYSPITLKDGREVHIGNGQWKSFTVFSQDGEEEMSDKFRKSDIREKMDQHAKLVTACINSIMSNRMKPGSGASALNPETDPNADFDPNSLSDAQALQDELNDAFEDI